MKRIIYIFIALSSIVSYSDSYINIKTDDLTIKDKILDILETDEINIFNFSDEDVELDEEIGDRYLEENVDNQDEMLYKLVGKKINNSKSNNVKRDVIFKQSDFSNKNVILKRNVIEDNSNKFYKNISNIAKQYLGIKYVYGGDSLKGIDCSALVRAIYRQIGIELPRVSRNQAKVGINVNIKDIKPGDLLYFKTNSKMPNTVSHVGIYIGNNKMIHASSKSKKVIEVDINSSYFMKRLSHVKRVI